MKTIAFSATAFTAAVASMPCAAFEPAFRHLQQGNGRWVPQNGFPNTNSWPQVGNVGGAWGNNGVGVAPGAFPQTGAFVNGPQSTGAQQAEEFEQTIAPTAATPTSAPVATGTPTTAGQDGAAQATIMVLLPDFLAPESSGSGSTMVLAGESSSQGDNAASSLPIDGAGETATKSGAATLLPAATTTVLLIGAAIAGFF